MQWSISIVYDRQVIRLKAERIALTEISEQYRIIARNRILIVQNNRPLLHKKGLKHRRIDWKLVDGHLQNTALFELICKQLEKHEEQ